MKALPVLPRFMAGFTIDPDSGCWVWHRARAGTTGYGQIGVDGRVDLAHRVAYREFVGPIPDGLVVDHVCRNRACVNPAHLEAVTQRVNMHRARPLVCKRGHAMTTDNYYERPDGNGGMCRACVQIRRARYV